jgi:endonuclease/exonuclease/phosphatase family metal-dependent hydrolase
LRRILPPLFVAAAVAFTLGGAVLVRHATPATATAVAPPASLSAAAAVGEQVRVASWNICGEAGSPFGQPGYCPWREQPERKVDTILNLIDTQQLNVVMLQEACSGPLVEDQAGNQASMLDQLQARLGAEWSTAWGEMQRPGGRSDCRGTLGGTLGVAIAVHGKIVQTSRRPLPVPHASRQADAYSQPTVLCVRVENWLTELCTTHLVNDDLSDSAYAGELAALTDFVTERPADPNLPHVVVGGDFNTRRWDTWLKPMHDRYDECDEKAYSAGDTTRESTIGTGAGNKIDYIFASAGFTGCDVLVNGYQDSSTTSTPNGASDHAPIVGFTAPLR